MEITNDMRLGNKIIVNGKIFDPDNSEEVLYIRLSDMYDELQLNIYLTENNNLIYLYTRKNNDGCGFSYKKENIEISDILCETVVSTLNILFKDLDDDFILSITNNEMVKLYFIEDVYNRLSDKVNIQKDECQAMNTFSIDVKLKWIDYNDTSTLYFNDNEVLCIGRFIFDDNHYCLDVNSGVIGFTYNNDSRKFKTLNKAKQYFEKEVIKWLKGE